MRLCNPAKKNVFRARLFASASFSPDKANPAIEPDNVFLPRWLDEKVLEQKTPRVKVSMAYLSFKNGTHRSVAFREAYLLNDEGKTIERL